MVLEAIKYDGSTSPPSLRLLEQRALPQSTEWVTIENCEEAHSASEFWCLQWSR